MLYCYHHTSGKKSEILYVFACKKIFGLGAHPKHEEVIVWITENASLEMN